MVNHMYPYDFSDSDNGLGIWGNLAWFIIIVVILATILTAIFSSGTPHEHIPTKQERCENIGGVLVVTYAASNCWKDGNYIKVE